MLTAYTDGACRGGNPGFCACAWVLYNDKGDRIHEESHYLGPELHTNNHAEYQGLIVLLEWLYKHQTSNVIIYCDSALVVNQVNDDWDVNSQDLLPLWRKAYAMRIQGAHTLKHVKGHAGVTGNVRADELCNTILDQHKEDYEKQT